MGNGVWLAGMVRVGYDIVDAITSLRWSRFMVSRSRFLLKVEKKNTSCSQTDLHSRSSSRRKNWDIPPSKSTPKVQVLSGNHQMRVLRVVRGQQPLGSRTWNQDFTAVGILIEKWRDQILAHFLNAKWGSIWEKTLPSYHRTKSNTSTHKSCFCASSSKDISLESTGSLILLYKQAPAVEFMKLNVNDCKSWTTHYRQTTSSYSS